MAFVLSLQIGVTYNLNKAPGENSFDFLLEVIRETKYEIEVKACSMWTENDQDSGMVVMDVGIPSGFELDWDSVKKVRMRINYKLEINSRKIYLLLFCGEMKESYLFMT